MQNFAAHLLHCSDTPSIRVIPHCPIELQPIKERGASGFPIMIVMRSWADKLTSRFANWVLDDPKSS